jgi:fatty acid-binding protein DegV
LEGDYEKVVIIADSTISMPLEMAKKYGIIVMPWHVIMDGKSYRDTEIDRKLLYAKLKGKENLPIT